MYKIEPMTAAYAEAIAAWRYPGEYAIYSFDGGEDTIRELMNGEYFSCVDARGRLVGYFCFGGSARIPTEAGYASDADKTDIGLGLAPELCGQGNGRRFMQSGIDYAKNNLAAGGLRLVVAEFNKRAIALYEGLGFVKIGEAEHINSEAKFLVMQRPL